MESIQQRRYFLDQLNTDLPLNEKLAFVHAAVKQYADFVCHISVSLWDEKTRLLKTFLATNGKPCSPAHRTVAFKEACTLDKALKHRRSVGKDVPPIFCKEPHGYPQKVDRQQCGVGYTFPMKHNQQCIGLIFFDSAKKKCFASNTLDLLDLFGHLIANIVINELHSVLTLLAAIKTAKCLIHYRNPETGNHVERMSRFARLIATELSKSAKHRFDEGFVEKIFVFSPLHDVGKIGIPDEILLKPEKLNKTECEVMKSHPLIGKQIVDAIIENFGFESFEHVDVLQHIAQYHHESMDGSGYPYGLKGKEIPIEARIIEVADIFDALTSARPYKSAWSNEEAFTLLRRITKTKLDTDCVQALIRNKAAVEQIQQDFRDKP